MTPIHQLTYLQAVVIGLIQGITELFPISSLGHTVLIPSWLGGSWAALVREESRPESPYLAFVVGLHLATAIVLLGVYGRTWIRVIRGFVTSITRREVRSADQKLAWLIVVATIPVGLAGLVLEHPFRVLFAKPLAAAIFLMINGGILLGGELLRRRELRQLDVGQPDRGRPAPAGVSPRQEALVGSPRPVTVPGPAPEPDEQGALGDRDTMLDEASKQRLAGIGIWNALWIGASQILALFAGISREGVTMVGGLTRGLNHEDAMRFSFLLSTPVILAAGILKISDLTGSLGAGVRGQIIAGSIAAAATSLFAVLFLARWFRTRTLVPFAVYCLLAGLVSVIRFGLF
ncbi:MAG TPA: undecaprenyl-diphosphate phosphatase [Streptosporangiaceae bacterium]|nr:undecaprenyl-diphosphate phosphatase [Streptosporangiaceae bacterium]